MYLPPGHPIIAIPNNRNKDGPRIGKKVNCLKKVGASVVVVFFFNLLTALKKENENEGKRNKAHINHKPRIFYLSLFKFRI